MLVPKVRIPCQHTKKSEGWKRKEEKEAKHAPPERHLSLCNNIGAGYQHILEFCDVVHCVTSYYRSGIVFTATSHGADPSHIDEPNLATLLREPRRQNFRLSVSSTMMDATARPEGAVKERSRVLRLTSINPHRGISARGSSNGKCGKIRPVTHDEKY
ncbi:hypothetical protein BO83DRAFT_403915 [Aspergillus eucalypticola CBS 122712]|uniref:Uncharacterized protein n=1 Tax=Aspergillus eucalypticola (strain CBS 122712 / IBT 29274) TaxID=1448314 RepID=A0A317UK90_ASPEC|nr:uncharacterized protein BO83DRAFT_403915 [Aspergillus eucalypticola CBS 122712]PWY62463.1 hypothetical protein BO83DRAFT_403915 [Aspergillus eucalypticola CBS 122712]